MSDTTSAKPTGYDKYVNYKTLSIAVGLFVLLLAIPMPSSMRDVAVEYSVGERAVLEFYTQELFGQPYDEVEQWQALTARVLEKNMRRGALVRSIALRQDQGQLERMDLVVESLHLQQHKALVESMGDEAFLDLMTRANNLRHNELSYDNFLVSGALSHQADPGLKNRKTRWENAVMLRLIFKL